MSIEADATTAGRARYAGVDWAKDDHASRSSTARARSSSGSRWRTARPG
jgi:hypothetical protein